MLRSELLQRPCTVTGIAWKFGLHPRTFSRHLAQEGTTFQKLVDEVRYEIARDLLAGSRMTLGQIAAILGFSEPSAFTRAFRRWAAQPPSGWRSSHDRTRKNVLRPTRHRR
jgi:AraC-like DNA-binding protein